MNYFDKEKSWTLHAELLASQSCMQFITEVAACNQKCLFISTFVFVILYTHQVFYYPIWDKNNISHNLDVNYNVFILISHVAVTIILLEARFMYLV